MSRTSKIPDSLQSEILAEFQKHVANGKLRGAYDRIAAIFPDAKDTDGKPFTLTKAMVKGICLPKDTRTVEEVNQAARKAFGKKAKAAKQGKKKTKKERRVKITGTDMMGADKMRDLFSEMRTHENEIFRIKSKIRELLG
jgi:hypothetical protein